MKKIFSSMLLTTCISESLCQDLSLQKLDSFISKAMSDWHTMGVAIAVIKNNSLVLAKGYGYRDYAKKFTVNENTIFPIASCSKTFASALMGMASDEKRVELDKPVHQYLPEFNLYNNELTQQATINDLLSHRTGVPGHDWAWTFNTNFPEKVYLERLRHLEPSAPLHTKYQYNSFMFFALSVLAEKVYNKNWNELVHEKIFRPLEMNNSYGSSAVLKNRENMSLTYQYRDSFQLEETRQMDDLLGAGALLSTSSDLAHWLQMWINGGVYKSNRILSGEYIRKAITSEIVVESYVNPEAADEPFTNMGLGWFLSSYRGHFAAHHTGNVSGYSSSITFFPFDSLGIVVLTNQNGSPLIRLIPGFIADLYFNLKVHDKNSVMVARRKQFEARQRQIAPINPDTVSKKPLLPFLNYCGNFFNPGYGSVQISPFQNGLLLQYFDLKLVLFSKGPGHVFSSHHIEDSIIYSARGEGDVLFNTGKNGNVESFSIPFEPAVKDIVFTRKK